MMLQIRAAHAWLAGHLMARRPDDRGDIVQTVIIVGLFAAAAILIVGILVAKATEAANSVRTQ
jgi:uncharacterized membrane protein